VARAVQEVPPTAVRIKGENRISLRNWILNRIGMIMYGTYRFVHRFENAVSLELKENKTNKRFIVIRTSLIIVCSKVRARKRRTRMFMFPFNTTAEVQYYSTLVIRRSSVRKRHNLEFVYLRLNEK